MYVSPHMLEQLIRDSQDRHFEEARARRLVNLALNQQPGIYQKVLLVLGEQLIAAGSRLKRRYSSASKLTGSRPFDRVL